MLVSMSLPLTLSLILVGPGPMATTPVAFSAASATGSNAGTAVRVVAAAATPVPRRKSRRDHPGPFLLRPCGSFIAVDPPLIKLTWLASCRVHPGAPSTLLAGEIVRPARAVNKDYWKGFFGKKRFRRCPANGAHWSSVDVISALSFVIGLSSWSSSGTLFDTMSQRIS